MSDRVWHQGDYVRLKCEDGAEFEGVLQDINDDFVMLNGFGFAAAMVKDIWVP